MAGVARGGQADELSAGRAFVARFARKRRVRPDQGEAVLMLLYVLDRNLPALHRVARLALRTHLPAMDVGVALSAFVSYVSEYKFYVTLRAGHLGMHSAQWVGSFVVIEIRHCADRFPAQAGMAGLAREIKRAVRTARGGMGRRLLLPSKSQ